MFSLNRKICLIIFLVLVFVTILVFDKYEKTEIIREIVSPNQIVLQNNETFSFADLDCFDGYYSDKNKRYTKIFNMTEDEAFLFGIFGKYWTKSVIKTSSAKASDKDIIYGRFGYRTRFENSPYCIKNDKSCNEKAFEKELNKIRKRKFVLVDLDNDSYTDISKTNVQKIKNFVIVRKSHIKKYNKNSPEQNKHKNINYPQNVNKIFCSNNIKIILSDSTSKIFPDRNCSSDICKEILYNINNSKESIDMAIYGYSSTPAIESALKSAQKRNVKIRMIYDLDQKGNNIYPDTEKFIKIISDNRSDLSSQEANATMHNKFYIFDNKTVITGSANLSHTDMSGYNSNSIIVISSPQAAKIYAEEFEQMYSGNFHNQKASKPNKQFQNIKILFSPQDKPITYGILPIIKNAKKYIYIPAFVITEKDFTNELINASARGVDIKVIADALNASTKHSKHKLLRDAGIQVKAENYAGKMHSKTIIVDDEYLIIGSMNFSNSGQNKNDENLIILHNPQAAKFYKNFFLYQWGKIPDKWLKFVPRAEGRDSIGSCSDGIDNNYDGFIDSQDDGCK